MEYGLFKLDKYKKVVDIFSKWAQNIQLFSWGEPILNKSLVEMIRYTSQQPHRIRTITTVNLNATNDEQIKGLLTSNLDALHVSIDGVTQEVSEKYRVGRHLETEFNNLPNSISSSGKIFQFLTAVSCHPFKSYPHIFFIRNLVNIAANKFSNRVQSKV